MEIQKIFSEVNGEEKIYSVLMTEDEYRAFSGSKKNGEIEIATGASLGIGGIIAGDEVTRRSGEYLLKSQLTAKDKEAVSKKLQEKAKRQGIRIIKDDEFGNSAYTGSKSGKTIKKGLAGIIRKVRKSDPGAARKISETIHDNIEIGTGSKKVLGALGKDAVVLGRGSLADADVLSHELGHAQYMRSGRSRSVLGKAAHKTMAASKMAMSNVGVAGSFAHGIKAGYDNELRSREGKKNHAINKVKSVALPAALVAPVLVGEGKASLQGLKMMKKSGASKELINQSRKRLGAAYGTYLGHASKPVISGAAGELVGRGVAKNEGKKKERKK